MKSVILVHGSPYSEEYYDSTVPSPSNMHWLPWIQKQCLINNILCQTPEFPKPYEPDYNSYCSVFEQFEITNETVLVGHSSGVGFILRYISEQKGLNPKRVILVAPWMDPEGELIGNFFDFEIDPELIDRTIVHLFISRDDDNQMHISRDRIQTALPKIIVHEFTNKGHFTTEDIGNEFPELLEIIVD